MQLKVQASTFLNAVKTVGLTWDLKKKKNGHGNHHLIDCMFLYIIIWKGSMPQFM